MPALPLLAALLLPAAPALAQSDEPFIFRECEDCPWMAVIPAGTFEMGSPESDLQGRTWERPQRTVTIRNAFSVGRYEVTRGQWDACHDATPRGCSNAAAAYIYNVWGQDPDLPIADIDWNAAQEYVTWLSQETGETYRLPTEAEWEYAARAGTSTRYPWGNDIGSGNAHCLLCNTTLPGGTGAPVGSYPPNAFGLYDMLGNVDEWVEDCWHFGYENAPTDERAWGSENSGDCDQSITRGGDLESETQFLRSSTRSNDSKTDTGAARGFRVARTGPAPSTFPVNLLTENAQGEYVAESEIVLREGDTLRFRAGFENGAALSATTTVRVRMEADEGAIAMGYQSSEMETSELTITSLAPESSPASKTAAGDSTENPHGTLTLTLLGGDGYELGDTAPVVTVTVLDDDGEPFTFQDCADCPEMVTIPGGSFMMGAPDSDTQGHARERPQHTATVSSFAIGRYEVTFAEWDACVSAGGCPADPVDMDNNTDPRDEGWGREQRPVINVSWADAKKYVAWLTEKTDTTYRLLTEAEWEYAARGGMTTAYYWGNAIGEENAHCAGCESTEGTSRTTEVGGFDPNPFGLYDMAGNVNEWVEDCWHEGYANAPTDGRAWGNENSGNCSLHVIRGGSYSIEADGVRSAWRNSHDTMSSAIGFRVARSRPLPLPPGSPDVNGDEQVNASDALILYYAYALRSELGAGR